MGKKKFKKEQEGPVGVKFTKPRFRIGGVEYISAEVEEAASNGNEEAKLLIARLVSMGASCVQIVED